MFAVGRAPLLCLKAQHCCQTKKTICMLPNNDKQSGGFVSQNHDANNDGSTQIIMAWEQTTTQTEMVWKPHHGTSCGLGSKPPQHIVLVWAQKPPHT